MYGDPRNVEAQARDYARCRYCEEFLDDLDRHFGSCVACERSLSSFDRPVISLREYALYVAMVVTVLAAVVALWP